MAEAKLEIRKVEEGRYRIALGTTEREAKPFIYVMEINGGADLENINMDPEEWPPEKRNGRWVVPRGGAGRFVSDSLYAENLKTVILKVHEDSRTKYFEVHFVDEATPEKREVTLAKRRTDYKLWRGPLGIEPRLRPAFVYNGLAFVRQILP